VFIDLLDKADIVCQFAIDFQLFLKENKKYTDDYIHMCSLFLLVSNKCLAFAATYRCHKLYSVKYGYYILVPHWEILGHMKHLEHHQKQFNTINRDHPHSQPQEARINCGVWSYPASTENNALVHDKWLEICIRFVLSSRIRGN